MELRHIRYFVRAAELLHFTRAAESLHVSQPALSLHIKQLEKEVGSPLFDRTGTPVRQVRLTEAGKRLLVHAQEILRLVERGKQELSDLRGLLCGRVTLAANNIFIPRLMSKCIPECATAYPNVTVTIKMTNQEGLESAILSGAADLALAWLPPDSKEIQVEPLFSDELVVVAAKTHPLAKLKTISLDQLNSLPITLPTPATNLRRKLGAEFAKHDMNLNIVLEIDDTPARLDFVKFGTAVTVAARSALDERADLRAISIAGPLLSLSAGLLKQKGAHVSNATQRLAEIIRKAFRK